MRRISISCICLAIMLCLGLLESPSVNAAELTAFSSIYSANLNGSFTLTGNTNQTCSTSLGEQSASCADARDLSGPVTNLNNDAQVMRNTEVSMGNIEASKLFNSSTNEISVPDGSTIEKAILFWFGTLEVPDSAQFGIAPNNEAKRDSVLFSGPAQDCAGGLLSACEITGTVATESIGGGQHGFYVAQADVTAKVAEQYSNDWSHGTGHKSALYSVGNIQGAQGMGTSSGWSLVVVYANPEQYLQHIEIKSGLALVAPRSGFNLDFSGFDSPLVQDVTSSVGVVGIDGDAGTLGDSLTVRSAARTTLASNSINASNNVMNSSISIDGQRSSYLSGDSVGRAKNTFGVEADRFTFTNAIENAAQSVRLNFTSSADSFYVAGAVLATVLGKSELKLTKYLSGITQDGAGSISEVTAGDTLEYTVAIDNIGVNTATNIRLEDVFDEMHLTNVQTATPGCAVVVTELVCANLGNLTPAGESLKVVVTAQVKPGSGSFSNLATATYGGHQGISTAISNVVTVSYAKLSTDLGLSLNFTKPSVQAGQRVMLKAVITNYGPASDDSPQLSLNIPVGLNLDSVLPDGCSQIAHKIQCEAKGLGIAPADSLLPGQFAHVEIVFLASGGKSKYRVNAVAQTGNLSGDPNTENNFASAVVGVNHQPIAQKVFLVAIAGSSSVRKSISPYVSDPDYDPLQIKFGAVPSIKGQLKLFGSQLVFTPTQTYVGLFTVRYFLSDGRGGAASSTITVQVMPASDNPHHQCRGFVRAGC